MILLSFLGCVSIMYSLLLVAFHVTASRTQFRESQREPK